MSTLPTQEEVDAFYESVKKFAASVAEAVEAAKQAVQIAAQCGVSLREFAEAAKKEKK